jgi:hypothetical protein
MVLLKSDFENMQFPSNPLNDFGKIIRKNSRRKSTATKSVKTAQNLSAHKETKNETKADTSQYQDHDWGVVGFEKALDYRIYFPNHNHDEVLKRYKSLNYRSVNKAVRQGRSIQLSPYSFDYLLMRKAERMRRLMYI